jgi:ribosome-associated protein
VKVETGRGPERVEGLHDLDGVAWVLMDYGDFIVHVFSEEARSYYDLERLWGNAPRVTW